MTPDIKAFGSFLWWSYMGLAIGLILIGAALLSLCSGCVLDTTGKDAGDEAAIHAIKMPLDAGIETQADVQTDVQVDVHDICCVIDPAKSGCGEELRGRVFTCGKAANGLTDVPWLCGETPNTKLSGCQQCHYGFWCHTVDGDGVVSPCQ